VKHREADFTVSRETLGRLQLYIALLARWNNRINLVSRADEPSVMNRHVADSLQLIELIPPRTSRGIDLGSGGGFPGLVLAIATDTPFDLIESDNRKAAFLHEAIRITAAPAVVHSVRAEKAELAPAMLITARAFAPVARILEWSHHLLAPGGTLLLPKGVTADEELTEARRKWHMRVEKFASQTGPGATILRLSEVARV
jgi:16S rRNA (guanine527-N7)-methyltransferase